MHIDEPNEQFKPLHFNGYSNGLGNNFKIKNLIKRKKFTYLKKKRFQMEADFIILTFFSLWIKPLEENFLPVSDYNVMLIHYSKYNHKIFFKKFEKYHKTTTNKITKLFIDYATSTKLFIFKKGKPYGSTISATQFLRNTFPRN